MTLQELKHIDMNLVGPVEDAVQHRGRLLSLVRRSQSANEADKWLETLSSAGVYNPANTGSITMSNTDFAGLDVPSKGRMMESSLMTVTLNDGSRVVSVPVVPGVIESQGLSKALDADPNREKLLGNEPVDKVMTTAELERELGITVSHRG